MKPDSPGEGLSSAHARQLARQFGLNGLGNSRADAREALDAIHQHRDHGWHAHAPYKAIVIAAGRPGGTGILEGSTRDRRATTRPGYRCVRFVPLAGEEGWDALEHFVDQVVHVVDQAMPQRALAPRLQFDLDTARLDPIEPHTPSTIITFWWSSVWGYSKRGTPHRSDVQRAAPSDCPGPRSRASSRARRRPASPPHQTQRSLRAPE